MSVIIVTPPPSPPPPGPNPNPPPQNPPPPGFVSTLNAAGEWRKWREDVPMVCAAGDTFSGRYDVARDSTEYWLLLAVSGDGTPTLTADAQGVYFRGY